jgi:hypothetical protein
VCLLFVFCFYAGGQPRCCQVLQQRHEHLRCLLAAACLALGS